MPQTTFLWFKAFRNDKQNKSDPPNEKMAKIVLNPHKGCRRTNSFCPLHAHFQHNLCKNQKKSDMKGQKYHIRYRQIYIDHESFIAGVNWTVTNHYNNSKRNENLPLTNMNFRSLHIRSCIGNNKNLPVT